MIKAFLYFPTDTIPEEVEQELTKAGIPLGDWEMMVLCPKPDEFMETVTSKKEGKKVIQHTLKDKYREHIEVCFPLMSFWTKATVKGKEYGVGLLYADE